MPYYSISWDEQNSPTAFAYFWALSQTILLLSYLLVRIQTISSMAFEKSSSLEWAQVLGFVEMICCLLALGLYLQLVINGIWHRTNPETSTENELESLDISPLQLNTDRDPMEGRSVEQDAFSAPLFGPTLEKMEKFDPVVVRDQIQWKRIILATVGMATIATSFVFLF